eukprot:gene42396-52576_t
MNSQTSFLVVSDEQISAEKLAEMAKVDVPHHFSTQEVQTGDDLLVVSSERDSMISGGGFSQGGSVLICSGGSSMASDITLKSGSTSLSGFMDSAAGIMSLQGGSGRMAGSLRLTSGSGIMGTSDGNDRTTDGGASERAVASGFELLQSGGGGDLRSSASLSSSLDDFGGSIVLTSGETSMFSSTGNLFGYGGSIVENTAAVSKEGGASVSGGGGLLRLVGGKSSVSSGGVFVASASGSKNSGTVGVQTGYVTSGLAGDVVVSGGSSSGDVAFTGGSVSYAIGSGDSTGSVSLLASGVSASDEVATCIPESGESVGSGCVVISSGSVSGLSSSGAVWTGSSQVLQSEHSMLKSMKGGDLTMTSGHGPVGGHSVLRSGDGVSGSSGGVSVLTGSGGHVKSAFKIEGFNNAASKGVTVEGGASVSGFGDVLNFVNKESSGSVVSDFQDSTDGVTVAGSGGLLRLVNPRAQPVLNTVSQPVGSNAAGPQGTHCSALNDPALFFHVVALLALDKSTN